MTSPDLDSLFDAIRGGDIRRVEAIIAANSSLLTQRNAQGISPLSWAAYLGQSVILQRLRARRRTPDFFEACIVGDEHAVRNAIAHKRNLDEFAPDGFTPVALAAFFGHPGIARMLVEAGADLNLRARNAQGVGPIHAAMARGDLKTLELLLVKGADVNARQQRNYTALHEAASSGNLAAVAMLLMYGADPTVKADDGATPVDLAKAKGHALAARLEEFAVSWGAAVDDGVSPDAPDSGAPEVSASPTQPASPVVEALPISAEPESPVIEASPRSAAEEPAPAAEVPVAEEPPAEVAAPEAVATDEIPSESAPTENSAPKKSPPKRKRSAPRPRAKKARPAKASG